jgi:hypothetical protein
MTKEDELFLCVFTKGMEIADIQTLTFHQGGLILSTIVEGHKDEYTWVIKDTATQCTIRTRLDREFFKPNFRGAKRNSMMVEGVVVMENSIRTEFQMEIPLKSFRLISYVSKHSDVVAFFFLILIAIGVWAVIVIMASASRTRTESPLPEKLVEIEEKRLVDICTIWYQFDREKRNDESCSRTESSKSSESMSSRAEEEDKREIEPYDEEEKREIEPYDEELVSYLPSVYVANRA